MSKWVELTEAEASLPPLDVPVWLWLGDEGIMIGAREMDEDGWVWCKCYSLPDYWGGKWHIDDAESDDEYNPTHWLALPEPPERRG